jgi:hypothetical protein
MVACLVEGRTLDSRQCVGPNQEGVSRMAWQWQSACSACVFVSSQLGSRAPCPSHAGRWSARISGVDHGEPSTFAIPRPTADRPWPFTPREYGRLLFLGSRVGEQRQNALSDHAALGERTPTPWSEEQPALPRPARPSRPVSGPRVPCARLHPYLGLLTSVRCEPLEERSMTVQRTPSPTRPALGASTSRAPRCECSGRCTTVASCALFHEGPRAG